MTLALSPVLVTPPAVLPLTAGEAAGAKAQSRVAGTEEDALFAAYIEAATQHLDGWGGILGRALVTQVWRQDFPCFTSKLRLPLAPVQTVDAVDYWDGANADTVLDPAEYVLRADALGPFVELAPDAGWPGTYARADAVRVTFTAGYGDAAAEVPAPIRQAIRLMVGHWQKHREAVTLSSAPSELPLAVQSLLSPYRRLSL